jgi:hypothetical protein
MELTRSNTPLRLLVTVVYLLGLFGIVASGGGSDSDTTGISYTGNIDPAVITSFNAARLVENVVIGQAILGPSSGGVARIDTSTDKFSNGIGLIQVPGRLTQKLRHTIQTSPQIASRSAEVQARTDLDETEPCDNSGGSVHITGLVEDNGTGTLILDYVNCLLGNETLDGTVTVQVNAFDFGLFLPIDAIYSFSVLTLTSSELNVSLDGSIHSQISIDTQTEQLTVDRLIARNNASGEMLMIRNQISIIEYDNLIFPSSLAQTITGRVYDSIHGYVDITTFVPLVFSTIDQIFADSGELLLAGGSNTSIRITVLAATVIMLELDLTGDGFLVGMFTVMRWDELGDTAGSDLGDDDNDGMHNSWERANGLDPNDATDAFADRDGDGASNIREYYAGTDPNSPGVVPDIDRLVIEATFFAPAVSHTAGSGPRAIVVDHFNLDGNLDVAVANWNDNGVSVLLGDGAGGLGSDASFAAGPSPSALAVGDFNGDGNKDLVVANFAGPSVSVLFGTGSGTFDAPVNFALTDQLNPTAVAVGDFNRDGNQDLAVTMSYGFSNVTPGHVAVLLGDGSGGFGAPASYAVGGTPRSVAIGDFNNDNKLDLAVANYLVGTVSILPGDGAGAFGAATDLAVSGRPVAVRVADFNGDLKTDLAVAVTTPLVNNAHIAILAGNGTGTFGPAMVTVLDRVNGAEPNGIATADLNGDGKLDLAVSNGKADNLFVLVGDGAGSFGVLNYSVSLGNQSVAVAAADLNGDFMPDLVAATDTGTASLATVSLNTLP